MTLSRKSQLLIDHPVWITGMGAISAAGLTAAELWHAAAHGICKRSWQDFTGNHRYLTAQVPTFTHLNSELRHIRKLDRAAQLAGIAAKEAMEQADLGDAPSRTGVIFGSSRGPLSKYLEAINAIKKRAMSPSLAATGTSASINGSIAQHWNLSGPSAMISTACASAAHAIAFAAEKIILGDADRMVTGGTDACLHPAVLGPLSAAAVLGSHENDGLACRPFDADRNGLIPGEGAGCLILESAESASRRGAKPLAILRGWAIGSDDGGRTGVSKSGSGLLRTMNDATQLAALSPHQIDYINAHGTGTQLNDLAEANAISSFQKDRDSPLPVSSTKPITGHCLGATPALEAIITISALHANNLPPTMGCLSQDPACQIDLITGQSRPGRAKFALSNSLGFWGHLASLTIESAS